MRGRDLVGDLRALDAELAAMGPSPRLEARLRARLRAANETRWPPGGSAARIAWPLGLAAAAVALLLGGGVRRLDRALARGATPPPLANEKRPAEDAWPRDPALPSRARPLPRIHAPSLAHPPGPPTPPDTTPVRREPPAPIHRSRPAPGWVPEVLDEAPAARPPSSRAAPSGSVGNLDPARLAAPLPGTNRPRALEAPVASLGPPARAPTAPPAAPPVATADPPSLAPVVACRSLAVLKAEAEAHCAGEGGLLVNEVPGDPCGDGTFQGDTVTCTSPSPDVCTSGSLGDGVTCFDPLALRVKASMICAAAGLALVDFGYEGLTCGDQAALAKYACCPADPEPAPQPAQAACSEDGVGDGQSCRSLGDLKLAAEMACEAKGSALTSVDFVAGACGDGTASQAVYACCR